MERLKRRAQFINTSKGVRAGRETFTLQAIERGDEHGPRVGFTVTKKTGNAVVRSRIRRRLRALCAGESGAFHKGTDYVVVARRAALHAPFDDLARDLKSAVKAVRRKLDQGVGTRA
ncbi:MAG: ribonuclease P protein component [Pseudomonadota bacterium]